MKRSEINREIKWAMDLLKRENASLPCFAYWTLEEFKKKKEDIEAIKRVMQGWDITDFGMGDYPKTGAVLFTIRNGDLNDTSLGTPYAEKFIMLKPGQRLPLHMHYKKTEDIINRGGGNFQIKLYNMGKDGEPDMISDVTVYCDGIKRIFKAGEVITITKGNSITLTPTMYHTFWAAKDTGDAWIGEVSSVNDDNLDNCFAEKVARFAEIEEDEPAIYPLCNEYN
jgi:D-lyxose ketol-isomerase